MQRFSQQDVEKMYRGWETFNKKKRQISLFMAMFVSPINNNLAIKKYGQFNNLRSMPLETQQKEFPGTIIIRTHKKGVSIAIEAYGKDDSYDNLDVELGGECVDTNWVIPLWRTLPKLLHELVLLFPELSSKIDFYSEIAAEKGEQNA